MLHNNDEGFSGLQYRKEGKPNHTYALKNTFA